MVNKRVEYGLVLVQTDKLSKPVIIWYGTRRLTCRSLKWQSSHTRATMPPSQGQRPKPGGSVAGDTWLSAPGPAGEDTQGNHGPKHRPGEGESPREADAHQHAIALGQDMRKARGRVAS
jgi:hypothetical protein